jgi:hypothetical protein
MPESHERPILRPTVKHDVSLSRRDYGYEITFDRINKYNERSSTLVVGGMSLEDLEILRNTLEWYLDEGRYQGRYQE